MLVAARTLRCVLLSAVCVLPVAGVTAQSINMFPANAETRWTRVAIPATDSLTSVQQWHIDAARGVIHCDGNGGHDWLRFNQELGNFDLSVKWRFVPKSGDVKYNSGVFFRSSEDGSTWHQAQTKLDGGYLFGLTPRHGQLTKFNLSKEMVENRVKPAGQWNIYRIRCTGGHCTLAVNGKVVNSVDLEVTKGYVGLEAEGAEIEFKSFHLKQMK